MDINERKIKIAIIGGGNIGTLLAADLSHKANVAIYSSKPNVWNEIIEVYDSNDNVLFTSARIRATNDLKECVENAKYVFVTLPAFMFEDIAEKLQYCLTGEQIVCIVPGSGGAEFAFKKLLDKGIRLIGFQRVHCIARIKEYGHSVYALGRKPKIEIASIPSNIAQSISGEISALFAVPCVSLSNYLCLTLTPSNPILHTSRLYALFKDYNERTKYPRVPLFYEEWDDLSSEYLLKMNDELQNLCDRIPLDLHEVTSLKVYYESYTEHSMTEKIRSIAAFKGITTPTKQCGNGGFIPDFSSRYFTSDFDYGLKIICDIADMFDIEAATLNKVYQWYRNITCNKTNAFELQLTKNEFLQLYRGMSL
ncbi:MAG: NAD/NADP octopine/nopaline dehydrogenase family protein [Clostridiales bacterium]|nr:NAD/NADP octopine/nopaline dehydrogenase family protein [Clostridiales bacterium]